LARSTTLIVKELSLNIIKPFNMKNIFILLLFSSIPFASFAQNSIYTDTLARKYDRMTIYLKNGGFEKDGQTIPYGMFKMNLRKELTISPMALHEYKRSRTNFWVGMGCSITSTVLMLSSIQSNGIKKELFYSGLGMSLLSIPFSISAQNQLNRSVWLYNRDVIVR
jgi:hypothetical protein